MVSKYKEGDIVKVISSNVSSCFPESFAEIMKKELDKNIGNICKIRIVNGRKYAVDIVKLINTNSKVAWFHEDELELIK